MIETPEDLADDLIKLILGSMPEFGFNKLNINPDQLPNQYKKILIFICEYIFEKIQNGEINEKNN